LPHCAPIVSRRHALSTGRRRQAVLPATLSPDLNPIEQVFAKLKALLRKADRRTVEHIRRQLGSPLNAFGDQECANYLRHAGYAST
jgi:transposase